MSGLRRPTTSALDASDTPARSAVPDAPATRAAPTAAPRVPAEIVVHLRRARDLIDRRFDEPLDLERLAAAAGFSRYHFARSFRAAYGETPAAYLTRRRIERAKQLLAGANLTVTEVCHLVGFQSLGSFSTRFSELVGVPPSGYRRRAVERGGPPPVPGCFVMAWARPNGSDGTRSRDTEGADAAGTRSAGTDGDGSATSEKRDGAHPA